MLCGIVRSEHGHFQGQLVCPNRSLTNERTLRYQDNLNYTNSLGTESDVDIVGKLLQNIYGGKYIHSN